MPKILLISPLSGIDPVCGDTVYTGTLLAHPPDGVIYETYSQALQRGALREHGTGRALRGAMRTRSGILSEIKHVGFQKSLNRLRKQRSMFWEPFQCFSVRPNEYDLIHMHVFSASFTHLPCPLVVSNAAPVRSLYRDARRYSELRFSLMEAAERAAGFLGNVNVTSYRLPQASRVIAFTEYLRDWYVNRKIMPAERVDVIPIYLPSSGVPANSRGKEPRRVGFIAKDFDAKGGPVLLKAFEKVRAAKPAAELVIVGCEPRLSEAEMRSGGIVWHAYVPRERLLKEILPSFDIFAYPTQFDGQPLVVIEALAAGIPIATSDYQAMPEMVNHGRAGLISPVGDAVALASNILKLLEPDTNRRYGDAATAWFAEKFSSTAVRPSLKNCYERAIEQQAA